MNDAPPTAIQDLAQWPRWVCWKTVERDGKTTKIPVTPSGRPASSTDPDTWSSHADCVKAVRAGRFDGIGYVFAEDDEYFGVDLDHCVKDGIVHPDAMQIVQRMASYTEFSPSGDGLHVIGRGAVNGKRNRTKKTPWGHDFEVYDRARFFTVTGRQLFGSPAIIEARQDELDAICAEMFEKVETANGKKVWPGARPIVFESVADDVALEEKIRGSKQGPRFAELFDRGAPEGQESEADLGLCNILAFWIGPDEARIDAWFRRSALMRGKWDSPRGETTYGGFTIARALEGRTEFYGQRNGVKPARPVDDDPELPYSERISRIFGIIDDPIIHGWRSKRGAQARVVFTTRSGNTLDIDNWKRATSSARTLSQEVRMQLEVDVTIEAKQLGQLDVLIGKFCNVVETMTMDQRARELGERFLQEAPVHALTWADQAQRLEAFEALKDRHPVAKARVDGTSIAAESLVLEDRASGIRYVRVQWFVDYVKANAVSGTAGAILEAIEQPGWWSRPNAQSRFMARHPDTGKAVSAVLFEVPADWETK